MSQKLQKNWQIGLFFSAKTTRNIFFYGPKTKNEKMLRTRGLVYRKRAL